MKSVPRGRIQRPKEKSWGKGHNDVFTAGRLAYSPRSYLPSANARECARSLLSKGKGFFFPSTQTHTIEHTHARTHTHTHTHTRTGVVWELLGGGASCSPVSDNHWTPLLGAAVAGHSEVARQLIGAGASVSETTLNGWNALHMASQGGHIGGCACSMCMCGGGCGVTVDPAERGKRRRFGRSADVHFVLFLRKDGVGSFRR